MKRLVVTTALGSFTALGSWWTESEVLAHFGRSEWLVLESGRHLRCSEVVMWELEDRDD